jgi:hypothetical protein
LYNFSIDPFTNNKAIFMDKKTFLHVVGTVFTLVALVHVSRIIFGWNFVIGTWPVAYWVNVLGMLIATFFAYTSFHLASKE